MTPGNVPDRKRRSKHSQAECLGHTEKLYPQSWKGRAVAEFFGAFWLVLGGCGAAELAVAGGAYRALFGD